MLNQSSLDIEESCVSVKFSINFKCAKNAYGKQNWVLGSGHYKWILRFHDCPVGRWKVVWMWANLAGQVNV